MTEKIRITSKQLSGGRRNEGWKHLRNSLGFNDSHSGRIPLPSLPGDFGPVRQFRSVQSGKKPKSFNRTKKICHESIAFINHENAPDALLKLGKFVEEKQLNEWIAEWTIRQSFTDWGKYNVKDKLKSAGIFDAEAVAQYQSTLLNPLVSPH